MTAKYFYIISHSEIGNRSSISPNNPVPPHTLKSNALPTLVIIEFP